MTPTNEQMDKEIEKEIVPLPTPILLALGSLSTWQVNEIKKYLRYFGEMMWTKGKQAGIREGLERAKTKVVPTQDYFTGETDARVDEYREYVLKAIDNNIGNV